MVLQFSRQLTVPNRPMHRPESYLPELLAGVLAARSLQDLRAARVLADEVGDVVDIVIDDNPKAFRLVLVLRYLLEAVLTGHCGSVWK